MSNPNNLNLLARQTGTMAMVAMDQRESLRTMFTEAGTGSVPDSTLIQFKLDVAQTLGQHASAFLIDRHFGFEQIRSGSVLPDECALILAADALIQEPGDVVEETDLDDVVASPEFDLNGVSAIKLLVIWRRDSNRSKRAQTAQRFIALARERGVLSVLEPVVRPTAQEEAAGTWDSSAAIREAARELSALKPDLYKVQVPLAGKASPEILLAECRLLNEAIQTPWVVLSQGVAINEFPPAVQAACIAGASGFLAGRALWSDVVGSADTLTTLSEVSVPRLKALCDIVDEFGHPWNQK